MSDPMECAICKEPESAVDLCECDGCHEWVCAECSTEQFDQVFGCYIINCERCAMEARHA